MSAPLKYSRNEQIYRPYNNLKLHFKMDRTGRGLFHKAASEIGVALA